MKILDDVIDPVAYYAKNLSRLKREVSEDDFERMFFMLIKNEKMISSFSMVIQEWSNTPLVGENSKLKMVSDRKEVVQFESVQVLDSFDPLSLEELIPDHLLIFKLRDNFPSIDGVATFLVKKERLESSGFWFNESHVQVVEGVEFVRCLVCLQVTKDTPSNHTTKLRRYLMTIDKKDGLQEALNLKGSVKDVDRCKKKIRDTQTKIVEERKKNGDGPKLTVLTNILNRQEEDLKASTNLVENISKNISNYLPFFTWILPKEYYVVNEFGSFDPTNKLDGLGLRQSILCPHHIVYICNQHGMTF